MHVVEMLFRNFVAGNLAANCARYWLSSAQSGILYRKHSIPHDYGGSLLQLAQFCIGGEQPIYHLLLCSLH